MPRLLLTRASSRYWRSSPYWRELLQGPPDRAQTVLLVDEMAGLPALLPRIHQLKGIYIDYAEDQFSHIPPGARAVSAQLAISGVPHTLETYDANHGDHGA